MTNAPVDHGARRYVAGGEVALVVNWAQPVPLPPTSLSLKIELKTRLIEQPGQPPAERWRVTTRFYAYTLIGPEGELLAYHWHPEIGVRFPHLHVYVNQHPDAPRLPHWHVPTARVALEDVLTLVLRDVKARPREPHWWRVLRDTKETFVQSRSWT